MDRVDAPPISMPAVRTTTRAIGGAEHLELKEFKAQFLDDYKAQSRWREAKQLYGRFYDGDQLTKEELQELQLRGQPPVVINRVKPKIDAIVGMYQELAVETKAFPMGDRENEASEISEKFRQIENNSHFNEEETHTFKDVLVDGDGYFETKREFDGVDSRLITEHLPNRFVTIAKHSMRADLKDAKRIHKHVWKDSEDVKALFPGHDEEIDGAVMNTDTWGRLMAEALSQYRPDQYQQQGGSRAIGEAEVMEDAEHFVDPGKKRLRIITTFYRTIRIRRFISYNGRTDEVTGHADSDVQKIRDTYRNAQEWTQSFKVLNSVTFCWNGILEHKKDIRPFDPEGKYSIVRAAGYTTRDEDKREPYGLVKQHLDPQREVNKRRSKMLHLLNTQQVWFEEGAFERPEQARSESVRPDGWIPYRKDFKVDRVTNEQLAQSQFQLLQESKSEIDHSGINQEIEGSSKAQSGREFQLRLKEGLKSIREIVSNMRAARRRVAEYWLDEILLDAKSAAEAQQQEFTLTKYDVVIEEAPESVNLMAETFEQLASLAKEGLPIPPNVLIQLAPIAPKYKEQIIQAWQQQQAAAAQQMQQQGGQPQPGPAQ